MDDKEPVPEEGPRLTRDPIDEEQEKKPVNRTARNITQLVFSTGVGGLLEMLFPTPQDMFEPDVCFSLNLGIFYFFLDRFGFRPKNYPIKYSLEDSFYLASGIMLGKSMVKAVKNIYMNGI
jgi:hypothetical protein